MEKQEIEALKSILIRERAARKQAELILEQKSAELYTINQGLEQKVKNRTLEIELLSRFPLENPYPVIRINQSLEIIFSNHGAHYLITQLEENPMIKKDFFEIIKQVIEKNELLDKEFEIGEKNYFLHFVPVQNQKYLNIYGHDITQQKQIVATLKQAETRYQQLVELASDIIYRSNFQGDFIYVNPVASRISGYSSQELLQMNFIQLVYREYREEVALFYKKQFSEGIVSTYFEFPMVNRAGDVIWLGQYVQIIFTTDNKINEFVAVARDITERKKVEFDLISARKKAEESVKVKEQFLANMSHEIRTPIHVILGMSKLLQEKALLNEEEVKYIKAVVSSGENLLVIINDILDFSKIEAGKLELENVDFSLQDSIIYVLDLLQFKAEEKDLSLEMNFSDKIHDFYNGASHRLNQVLINVINNAIKFTEKGSITISVDIQQQNEQEEVLLFQIEDTGIGIPTHQLKTIFNDFSQADVSNTRKYGGTGLGLSISRKLIQLMGGDIGVRSEVGKGTTFYFYLPFQKIPFFDKQEPSILSYKKHFEGVSVLLAEDNPYNQLFVQTILNDMNIHVEVANNGKEATEIVQKKAFDFILMDVQMPIMNGIEATHYILETLKIDIPIIALTANALKGDKDKYLKEGMVGYISKPFYYEDIYAVIEQICPHKIKNTDIVNELVTQKEEKSVSLLYDLGYLQSMKITDETFIPTMIQSFIDNTYTVLQEFQTDYLFKEPQKMGKLAHRLLGSCRTFKMTEISNYLEHIEEAGINQDWDLVQKSYLSVMPLFIKVLEQLKNIK